MIGHIVTIFEHIFCPLLLHLLTFRGLMVHTQILKVNLCLYSQVHKHNELLVLVHCQSHW